MPPIFRSLIKKKVDRLFSKMKAKFKRGDYCENPVTDDSFIWEIDPIAEQEKWAILVLLAREYLAAHAPPDAPPLPLNQWDVDRYRGARGLKGVVGFYARSLDRQDYDFRKHPSFDDFARGLMDFAIKNGLWDLEKDKTLIKRFPPRPLKGMTRSAFWAPPKEYKEIMASYRRHQQAALARMSA
jgi:hypothetical protein